MAQRRAVKIVNNKHVAKIDTIVGFHKLSIGAKLNSLTAEDGVSSLHLLWGP